MKSPMPTSNPGKNAGQQLSIQVQHLRKRSRLEVGFKALRRGDIISVGSGENDSEAGAKIVKE